MALFSLLLSGETAAGAAAPTEIEFTPGQIVADGDTLDTVTASQLFRCEGLHLLFKDIQPDPAAPRLRAARARFLRTEVALAPGPYEATAVLFGAPGNTSPMEIWSGAQPVVTDLLVPNAARQEITFSFTALPADTIDGGRTSLLWKPTPGEWVALEKLTVRRVDEAPHGSTDGVSAGADTAGSEILRAQLREICDYLLANQTPGFYGFDYTSTAWWEASMAVRVLLAGSEILQDSRYARAATAAVESFRARQWDDGGFCSYLEGMENPIAEERRLAECDTRNRADLGSITSCLSLVALALPESERGPYLQAHRRYLEARIYDQAFPDGSYSNGVFEGRDYETPYSVATATTALSLAAFYAATGEERARTAAEGAATFLARSFNEDGSFQFHFHDQEAPGEAAAHWFHNLYYVIEGMIAVHYITDDSTLRHEIAEALSHYYHGSNGLAAKLGSREWISVGARRNLGKANGMLGLLAEIHAMCGPSPDLERRIAAGTTALGDPTRRQTYAILLPPYLRSSEKTIVCTSFAGLSIATRIQTGILFPSR